MLSRVITRLKGPAATYTVTRRALGAVSEGIYTPGGTSTFTIVATVQPVDGRKLEPLPEAFHGSELCRVYTETELRTAGAVPADTITIAGETWTIARVAGPWSLRGSIHYEATAARTVIP